MYTLRPWLQASTLHLQTSASGFHPAPSGPEFKIPPYTLKPYLRLSSYTLRPQLQASPLHHQAPTLGLHFIPPGIGFSPLSYTLMTRLKASAQLP
ncbi:hypothetical protein GDO78_001047 [Eleutherodactylus coqui]|uniref:Uncharacterized protein n=1 Tax=Eleutherodactylus coqui TaxID=57060 RepID=A0A8J6FRN5_ELECQ|nr:hypothetical protein GDO78_001047 [Eleutherodactylus coqui]